MRDYQPFIEHLESDVDDDTLYACAYNAFIADFDMLTEDLSESYYGFERILFDAVQERDATTIGWHIITLWERYCKMQLDANWATVAMDMRQEIARNERGVA